MLVISMPSQMMVSNILYLFVYLIVFYQTCFLTFLPSLFLSSVQFLTEPFFLASLFHSGVSMYKRVPTTPCAFKQYFYWCLLLRIIMFRCSMYHVVMQLYVFYLCSFYQYFYLVPHYSASCCQLVFNKNE